MRKGMLLALSAALIGASLAGCSGKSKDDANGTGGTGKKVEITALISKPELSKQFDQMAEAYNKFSDTGRLTLVTVQGNNYVEGLTTMYAAKNAPTVISAGEAWDTFKGNFLDLSQEPWVKHAAAGTLDFVKDGDKILGMPVNMEAFGLIYNKKVLDEAVGGSFDPSTIKTRSALEGLFKKIEAKGKKAVHISPMDWSLGAHLTNVMFAGQSDDRTARHQFLDDMKAGKVNLMDNKVFTGWVDTFDLMKKYNTDKNDPLTPVYDDGTLRITSGDVGMWFMGNWVYPQIKEADPDGEYGFLPVPVSDNAGDYGNSQISVGLPFYYCIDATQATKEQQEEGKKFLNWLVSNEEGQKFVVDEFNFIPVYDNFKLAPSDSLSKSVLAYSKAGQTLEGMNSYYPSNMWPAMGASLQKYLSGKIDRAGLAAEFEKAWKAAK